MSAVILYLFYGFAFLSMGVVLGVHGRAGTATLGKRCLTMLVAFALLHGAAEWTRLVTMISGAGRSIAYLPPVGVVLTAASFAFLMQFGVEVLSQGSARTRWPRAAGAALLSIWGVAVAVVTRAVGGISDPAWPAAIEAITRPLLGFTSGALAAVALFVLSRRERTARGQRAARSLSGAALAFGVYAVATGLCLPPTALLPRSWLDLETFRATTGFPIELVRTVAVVACGWLLSEGFVVDAARARLEEERRRAATAETLRDKDERLRLAVEAGHIGIWSRSLATNQIEWNPESRRLAGFGPEEDVTFERFFAAVHPDDRARMQAAVRAAIAARSNYVNEYRVIWPDGSTHWMRVLGRAQNDTAGRPAALLGVTLDVTDAKQAEQVLAEEARHREEILRAERAARTEIEKVARLKDEFLATLSHELRTPLTAILGWADRLARREHDPDVTARGLASIQRNARSLAQIVSDLLDVSRIISGKAHLDVRPTDLRGLVEEALAATEPSAQNKQIRLEAELEPAPAVVRGDAIRLQQVVWNLLSNAVKFTPRGGRVRVVLHTTSDSALIEVSDTGQGIEPEFLPRVFDRFRQADASSKRTHAGLGLGLALVKDFVELHGGTVRAESAGPGRGATFAVTLPLAPTTGAPVTAAARRAPEELAGVKVLVVEDDTDTSDLLKRILEEHRADVVIVDSAAKALLAVQRFRPDVLLSDIGMPGQDGYQLIRALRALAPTEGGKTPAAALTAFAAADDRTRALGAGFQEHIAKPIDLEKLVSVVSSLAVQAPAA